MTEKEPWVKVTNEETWEDLRENAVEISRRQARAWWMRFFVRNLMITFFGFAVGYLAAEFLL